MINANIKLCLSLIVFYSFVSCVTNERVQKDHCEGLNTYKQGYSDALRGQSSDDFKEIINSCAKYEVKLSQDDYNKGYQEGIKNFCTKKRGYDWGASGKKSLGICAGANIEQFSKGYEEGNKKCWYEIGSSHAKTGFLSSKFTDVGTCMILSESQNKKEYNKGWKQGVKVFCAQSGHHWGRTGRKNPGICRSDSVFSRGYKKGNKECWYETGYSHAERGYPSSKFDSVTCELLSKKQNRAEYNRGWQKGMKALCSLDGGYRWGLTGQRSKPDICPQSASAQFSEGYIKGIQQYEENKRHQQLLNLERERIRAEEKQKQRELELKRQKMHIKRMQKQQLIDLEQDKIREQRKTRKEILKLQKLGKRRLCKYSSDCGSSGYCSYDYSVRDYVCKYN